MLFNSNEFLAFFVVFALLYWMVRRWLGARNVLVVLASYVFYCWWDYRLGALLLFTSLADFGFGRLIVGTAQPGRRRLLLAVGLGLNLGVLGFFKYFGFFAEGLNALLTACGIRAHRPVLAITLPIGISFYTFQAMGYLVDVARGRIPAARRVWEFLAFVSFFPQLVAGPIERAADLLPQFARTLRITALDLEHGFWLITWGLFQKVVLADNLAPLADLVFGNSNPSLPLLLLGAVAFGLQVLCDFSGYTDIARGLAKWLGFDLRLNFNVPYAATSLREFWRRWHISLSTWFRDYLYIPLGGNRLAESRTCLNLLITMLLAGLWHGASANFLFWGAWHGGGLVINHTWNRLHPPTVSIPGWAGWVLTMAHVFAGWILFRTHSLEQLIGYSSSLRQFTLPGWWTTYVVSLLVLAMPVVLMAIQQVRQRQSESFLSLPRTVRIPVQALMLLAVSAWWQQEPAAFIYFQF